MGVDKSHMGLIFNSPRATAGRQEAALRAAGASWIVKVGKNGIAQSWRDPARQVRPGYTVYVYALVLVPTKRGEDELPPSGQIGDFVAEVHSRGGCIVEPYTGRNSCDPKQRRAMIKDAINGLRSSGKPLPEMGRAPGRPAVEWTDEQLLQAREAWFSKDYATNAAAAKHMPKGFGARRAWLLFGKSGRPHKRKRR